MKSVSNSLDNWKLVFTGLDCKTETGVLDAF